MTSESSALRERPREKLFDLGAKNLSDAELVSLLLGSGGKESSALDLSRELLHEFDGLAGLLSTDFRQISRVSGIGPARAASLAAMRELGHRQLYAEVQGRDVLSSSQGTIDGAAVYPREVVERCISYNAAAVILAHNHPSGIAEPSQADIAITRKLRVALETIDVRVLDHLIVGSSQVVSLAERGLM